MGVFVSIALCRWMEHCRFTAGQVIVIELVELLNLLIDTLFLGTKQTEYKSLNANNIRV